MRGKSFLILAVITIMRVRLSGSIVGAAVVLGALTALVWCPLQTLYAQAPPGNDDQPQLSTAPDKLPTQSQRFDDASAFIQSLTKNDATFEVIVGQGRLLTTNEDIALREGEIDKQKPFIAVGDPDVVEIEPVGPRHIRLTGLKLGVTDLAITSVNERTYSFEVQVVVDVNFLRARLKQVFPEATLTIRQIRDHLVVGGDAPSDAYARRIITIVEGYLQSIESASGRGSAPADEQGTEAVAKTKQAPPDAGSSAESTLARGRIRGRVISLINVPDPLIELQLRLRHVFPGSAIQIRRIGDKLAVEGEARDSVEASNIIRTIAGYSSETASLAGANGERLINLIRIPDPLLELQMRLQHTFPDSAIEIRRVGDKLAVEGQARTAAQVSHIMRSIAGYSEETRAITGDDGEGLINLIRVPGPQQVLLKVQIAELNRTSMREIGADWNLADGNIALGNVIGSQLADLTTTEGVLNIMSGIPTSTTGFAIFDSGDIQFLITALRQNAIIKILAEPTLVAYHGHQASFRSGGEFPVPVPQSGASTGAITIEYKQFGVSLDFVPYLIDGETIRMSVAPEVSSVDNTLGTTVQGTTVPGVITRNAQSVVELRQGQTLAIAGLLQTEDEAITRRIPLFGDLPVVGAMFSNNTARKVEKELVVLVTPHLVEAMSPDQVPPLPGHDVREPNDLEFYLKGRIEGRVNRPFRSTTHWDDPLNVGRHHQHGNSLMRGNFGYSD